MVTTSSSTSSMVDPPIQGLRDENEKGENSREEREKVEMDEFGRRRTASAYQEQERNSHKNIHHDDDKDEQNLREKLLSRRNSWRSRREHRGDDSRVEDYNNRSKQQPPQEGQDEDSFSREEGLRERLQNRQQKQQRRDSGGGRRSSERGESFDRDISRREQDHQSEVYRDEQARGHGVDDKDAENHLVEDTQPTVLAVGTVIRGQVVRIESYGAFVEFQARVLDRYGGVSTRPEKLTGLVHISQMAMHRVDQVTDIVQMNDVIYAVVLDVQPDDRGRLRIRLSLLGVDAETGSYDASVAQQKQQGVSSSSSAFHQAEGGGSGNGGAGASGRGRPTQRLPAHLEQRARRRLDQTRSFQGTPSTDSWRHPLDETNNGRNDADMRLIRQLWSASPEPPMASSGKKQPEQPSDKRKRSSKKKNSSSSVSSDSSSDSSSDDSSTSSSSSDSRDRRSRRRRGRSRSSRETKRRGNTSSSRSNRGQSRRKRRRSPSESSSSSSSSSRSSSSSESRDDRRARRRESSGSSSSTSSSSVKKNELPKDRKRQRVVEGKSIEVRKDDDTDTEQQAKLPDTQMTDEAALRVAQEFKAALQAKKNEDDSDDDDDVGPQPLMAGGGGMDAASKASYGKALLPGEGQAIAQYVQQNLRIPRRGEIGYSQGEIEKYERAGFVMSGSRHARMNAVRLRKENQVYSAEEQRALALITMEEKQQKEAALVENFRSMLKEKKNQRDKSSHQHKQEHP